MRDMYFKAFPKWPIGSQEETRKETVAVMQEEDAFVLNLVSVHGGAVKFE